MGVSFLLPPPPPPPPGGGGGGGGVWGRKAHSVLHPFDDPVGHRVESQRSERLVRIAILLIDPVTAVWNR